MKNSWNVLGLMSGTSLDGLDIALCRFEFDSRWSFEIQQAKTFEYSEVWRKRLSSANNLSANELWLLNAELGNYFGVLVKDFLNEKKVPADFISSHGHTIFHQPEKSMTLQIGSAAHIAAFTNLPVVADFRTKDVALGGQGAPLVPIGDKMLFSEYDFCLNLGGIANISFDQNGKRIAFDICPVNMALNFLAEKIGMRYDDGGRFSSTGNVNKDLLSQLNSLSFYTKQAPKSLGKEWFDKNFLPLLESSSEKIPDTLRTCCEHIAIQIGNVTADAKGKMLVTGGGAWNHFLVERIRANTKTEVIIPHAEIVNFKEALVFAFLGLLRWRNEVNNLQSVTGAIRDSVGGCIYI